LFVVIADSPAGYSTSSLALPSDEASKSSGLKRKSSFMSASGGPATSKGKQKMNKVYLTQYAYSFWKAIKILRLSFLIGFSE
jgi:hypothetical protein